MDYTKGEWEKTGNGVTVLNRGIIAECPRPQNNGVFERYDNAQLISAAPIMYEGIGSTIEK